MDILRLDWEPRLRSPWLVLGFEGWPNAAEVSSGCIRFLREKLGALQFGEIEAADFYQNSSHRPIVSVRGGLVNSLNFPSSKLYAWTDPHAVHDLVLLEGVEPDLRWQDFIGQLLDLAQRLGVVRTLSIGGVLSAIPHSREPRVSCAFSHERLRPELAALDVEFSDYEGPSSIHSSLLLAAQTRGLEGVSFWGSAPHYVQGPNPLVWHAVLRRVSRLLALELPLEELAASGEALRQQVEQGLQSDAEARAYVRKLEEVYDTTVGPQTPSADEKPPPRSEEPLLHEDVLKGVEELLKRRQKGGPGGPG